MSTRPLVCALCNDSLASNKDEATQGLEVAVWLDGSAYCAKHIGPPMASPRGLVVSSDPDSDNEIKDQVRDSHTQSSSVSGKVKWGTITPSPELALTTDLIITSRAKINPGDYVYHKKGEALGGRNHYQVRIAAKVDYNKNVLVYAPVYLSPTRTETNLSGWRRLTINDGFYLGNNYAVLDAFKLAPKWARSLVLQHTGEAVYSSGDAGSDIFWGQQVRAPHLDAMCHSLKVHEIVLRALPAKYNNP